MSIVCSRISTGSSCPHNSPLNSRAGIAECSVRVENRLADVAPMVRYPPPPQILSIGGFLSHFLLMTTATKLRMTAGRFPTLRPVPGCTCSSIRTKCALWTMARRSRCGRVRDHRDQLWTGCTPSSRQTASPTTAFGGLASLRMPASDSRILWACPLNCADGNEKGGLDEPHSSKGSLSGHPAVFVIMFYGR